jgi:transposase
MEAGCCASRRGPQKIVFCLGTWVRVRDVTAFKHWLLDAAASELQPFARLAAGRTDDLEAITNAFRYPWSTRQ